MHTIDDRGTGSLLASNGNAWRLVTDGVMGGRSSGSLLPEEYRGRRCLRLRGAVSTANNGGFVQAALDLAGEGALDASMHQGIALQVAGNGEEYNLHLRTPDLWLPWQSYRARFVAGQDWTEIRLPFSAFAAYRTRTGLRTDRLSRIGVVAIGRAFEADVCIGDLYFYGSGS